MIDSNHLMLTHNKEYLLNLVDILKKSNVDSYFVICWDIYLITVINWFIARFYIQF
jgi:hypothetical protein